MSHIDSINGSQLDNGNFSNGEIKDISINQIELHSQTPNISISRAYIDLSTNQKDNLNLSSIPSSQKVLFDTS